MFESRFLMWKMDSLVQHLSNPVGDSGWTAYQTQTFNFTQVRIGLVRWNMLLKDATWIPKHLMCKKYISKFFLWWFLSISPWEIPVHIPVEIPFSDTLSHRPNTLRNLLQIPWEISPYIKLWEIIVVQRTSKLRRIVVENSQM